MALAETANLIVALKLDDRLSGPLRGISGRLNRMNVDTGLLNQGLGKVSRGVGVGLRNSLLLGAAAGGALATQIAAGIGSLRELESVNQQTIAGLESTGAVSGQTAQSIRDLSEEYEELGGVIDDKVIQAGANVILTFTNIREDAFEPAIEAALDLSTRMGTDLSSAALQVGKALNDPIRGLTALRRVGVQFSADQEAQIRALVEQNDLYGAQQIILQELNTEFGGSFAAQGRTNEATVARFRDAIEGLQQSLARGFLPVIDKVARRLTELFNRPETIAAVEDFGNRLAGFFDDSRLDAIGKGVESVFGYLAKVPWGTIGDGLRIAGSAAKVVIDAFNALPKEVQGVVITALAANKLTGGLVASGIGDIGKALTGNFFARGSSPANPLFVSAVGGLGGAGGTGGGAGGLGVVGGIVGTAGLIATIQGGMLSLEDIQSGTREGVIDGMLSQGVVGLITNAVEGPISELIGVENQNAAQASGDLKSGFSTQKISDNLLLDEARHNRADLAAGTRAIEDRVIGLRSGVEGKLTDLETGLGGKTLIVADRVAGMRSGIEGKLERANVLQGNVVDRVAAMRAGMEGKLERSNVLLGNINAKPFSTDVTLNQDISVSATLSAAQAQTAIQIHNTITQQANKGNVP